MLGVAVIGLGVGEAHARTFAGLEGCTLRTLVDLDTARAERLARELGTGAAGSFEAVLADDTIDVVSIASYDDAHAAQTVAALRAGKHVFVEKPLARSLRELRDLKQAWEASGGVHLASNLVLRAAPAFRWLREAIAAGELGDVYAVDGDYLYGRIHKITEGWRKDVADYSVMQGGGVHLVDLMLWITGAKPAAVTAIGNRVCTADSGFRYNDYAAATFAFPSTMIGRITANFGCQHRHQHVLRVFGTRATFISDDAGVRLHEGRDDQPRVRTLEHGTLPFGKGALIPDFVEAIADGRDPKPAAQHEFDVISACIAADEAATLNTSVEVMYV